MNALEKQVGGEHYKNNAFQPIQLIVALNLNFIEGCIIKYITRYKNKNGVQDIMKCIHYSELAKELNHVNSRFLNAKDHNLVNKYYELNNLTGMQRDIILLCIMNDYSGVINMCNRLINSEKSINK